MTGNDRRPPMIPRGDAASEPPIDLLADGAYQQLDTDSQATIDRAAQVFIHRGLDPTAARERALGMYDLLSHLEKPDAGSNQPAVAPVVRATPASSPNVHPKTSSSVAAPTKPASARAVVPRGGASGRPVAEKSKSPTSPKSMVESLLGRLSSKLSNKSNPARPAKAAPVPQPITSGYKNAAHESTAPQPTPKPDLPSASSKPQAEPPKEVSRWSNREAEVATTSAEKLPHRLAVGEASALASYHEARGFSDDTILCDDELGLFGVFDGVGQGGKGYIASRAAVQAASDFYNDYPAAPASRAAALDKIKQAMTKVRQAGDFADEEYSSQSVGVFTKLDIIDGKPVLTWANCGDCRLFVQQSPGGPIVPISTDQSVGNEPLNHLHRGDTHISRDEFGILGLKPGARIMICSDGITGDWANQFLTDEEFLDGFSQPSVQAAADRFLELSKKNDDKSVLVIDVERLKQTEELLARR